MSNRPEKKCHNLKNLNVKKKECSVDEYFVNIMLRENVFFLLLLKNFIFESLIIKLHELNFVKLIWGKL